MKFTEFCKEKNIQLLRDDKRFIVSMVNKLPRELHKDVLTNYIDKWLLGYSEEKKTSLKQNSGRLMANSWLRESVKTRLD